MIRRVQYGAGAALVLLLALSACSPSADPEPGPSTPSPPPVTSTSPPMTPPASPDPTASASAGVLKAYLGFQHAVADAQRTANAHSKKLEKYGADKALAQARGFLIQLERNGVVLRGEPRFDPTVTRVELGEQRAGWIRDCIDGTNWKPIYKATGKSALAPGQHPRVPAVAQVGWNGDRWVVRTLDVDRSATC